MAEFKHARIGNRDSLKLRLQLAGAAAGIGLAVAFMAVKVQSQEYLTSRPASQFTGRSYSRLWFDAEDRLVGARQAGAKLTIERSAGGKTPGPGVGPGLTRTARSP